MCKTWKDPNPVLDWHQNGKSDPDQYQDDADHITRQIVH